MPVFTAEYGKKAKRKEARDEAMDDSDEYESYGDEIEMDGNYPEELDDSEEEKEDFTIRKTDSVLVAATAESDHSNLEVYIYDHSSMGLFVHHEIILASYPLCLQWIPQYQGE